MEYNLYGNFGIKLLENQSKILLLIYKKKYIYASIIQYNFNK